MFPPMIDPEKKAMIKMRCNLVLNNLSQCNSGNEIHIVANLRHIAYGILEIVDDRADEKLIMKLLESTERQQLEFFQKKFGRRV